MAEKKTIKQLVDRLSVLLATMLYPPRPAHPVVGPYATIDRCSHGYLSDGDSWVVDAAELADLMAMDRDRAKRIVSKNPLRASEQAPGCAMCSIERGAMRRGEPLHWRLN